MQADGEQVSEQKGSQARDHMLICLPKDTAPSPLFSLAPSIFLFSGLYQLINMHNIPHLEMNPSPPISFQI